MKGKLIKTQICHTGGYSVMFRQELKYQLTEYNFGEHLEVLQSAGLSQPYPARTVNSLYFDNDQFQMYADSEEGVLPRKRLGLDGMTIGKKLVFRNQDIFSGRQV